VAASTIIASMSRWSLVSYRRWTACVGDYVPCAARARHQRWRSLIVATDNAGALMVTGDGTDHVKQGANRGKGGIPPVAAATAPPGRRHGLRAGPAASWPAVQPPPPWAAVRPGVRPAPWCVRSAASGERRLPSRGGQGPMPTQSGARGPNAYPPPGPRRRQALPSATPALTLGALPFGGSSP